MIDGVAPTVTSVTSTTSDGTLKIGDVAAIMVTFSEWIIVNGIPELSLNTGQTLPQHLMVAMITLASTIV